MANSVSLSELHGVVICDEEDEGDQGFDEHQHLSDVHDDVFVDDERTNQDDVEEQSIVGGLKEFPRERKKTSRSSGYGSENPTSEIGGERKFFENVLNESLTTKQGKEKISVFSQTDFSSDEEEMKKNLPLQVLSPKIQKDALPEQLRHFCWRHDSVYDKLVFPPARPSSVSSDSRKMDKKQRSYSTDLLHPKKVNLSNRACQKCKYEENNKIDLCSRKESNNLRKETLHPTVAEVKNCSINLLADEIDHCSNLWTENRTFYLGTPRRKSCHSAKRERSLSFPTNQNENLPVKQWNCFHCSNEALCNVESHRSCSRHLFWIQRVSLSGGGNILRKKEIPKKNKRDWILVQCVTKFVLNKKSSFDDEMKFSYREYGAQEMLLCPHELRSLEYIEDICCQHFIKSTRTEALQESRVLELLYSPKGPMLREEKHLEGKSIFYFCCDFPIKSGRRKSTSISYQHYNNIPADFESKPTKIFEKIPSLSAKSPVKDRQRHPSVGFYTNKVSKFLTNRRHHVKLHTKNSGHESFSTNYTNKKEKRDSKQDLAGTDKSAADKETKTVEKLEDKQDDKMKKNVSFAENLKADATKEIDKKSANKEEIKNRADLARRHSMPAPPPKYLGEEESDVIYRRRKRRESVAIAFNNNPPPIKKDNPPLAPANIQSPVRPYEKPTWVGVKIKVGFKDKIFTGDFMEYQTLEDLYSWVKTQLLNNNMFTPGTDLLLSSANLKFPLKANTANHTMSSLPFAEFVCTEIQQGRKGSGFGDTESRYDTRFSLPVDLRKLESLTPVQYLSKYCSISETWKIFYRSIFTHHDGDKDGCISYKELTKAMEKLFVELAHPLLKRVLYLLGFDPSSQKTPFSINHSAFDDTKTLDESKIEKWKENLTVEKETFVYFCALSNRIICRENKIDGFSVAAVMQSHTELEDADFYNIEGKLKECTLHPLTKTLLLYIKK